MRIDLSTSIGLVYITLKQPMCIYRDLMNDLLIGRHDDPFKASLISHSHHTTLSLPSRTQSGYIPVQKWSPNCSNYLTKRYIRLYLLTVSTYKKKRRYTCHVTFC